MNVGEAYTLWAETYDIDENLTRDLDQAVTKEIVGSQKYPNILETGCGTGKNTKILAESCESLLALDFSEGMISKAKRNSASDKVHFEIADLTKTWPCHDSSFDLISCNLVLEHIQNIDFIFSEAHRALADNGLIIINELHPIRQYLGSKAHFHKGDSKIEITAHIHNVSDFIDSAERNGLRLVKLKEHWHEKDEGKPPRIISFVFKK